MTNEWSMNGLSWLDIAALIIALGSVFTATFTWRVVKRVELILKKADAIHHGVNGRMEELISTTRMIAEAKGQREEKAAETKRQEASGVPVKVADDRTAIASERVAAASERVADSTERSEEKNGK